MDNAKALTFYTANKRGIASNACYPNERVIHSVSDLEAACANDFVCAKYKENHRSKDNFIFSDCLAMDCDNDHSDDSKDWKTPEDVAKAFPDVAFAIQYSRHHNLPKDGKSARPRFHVFFYIYRNEDWKDYTALKRRVKKMFPWFDEGAMDAARFFFGTENPQVEIHDGSKHLDDLLFELDFPEAQDYSEIPEGQRYITLRNFAAAILTRYGPGEKARGLFLKRSADCNPPLENEELETIWSNGLIYFDKVISKSDNYIPPEVYNSERSYKPANYTNKGQADVLSDVYKDKIAFTDNTKFLCYTGTYWKEDQHTPWRYVFDLSGFQLREAARLKKEIMDKMDPETQEMVKTKSPTVVKNHISSKELDFYLALQDVDTYKNQALNLQNEKYVKSTLACLTPLVVKDITLFDDNPYLLNTPRATYDLTKGLAGARKHDPKDRITKITAVSPSDKGKYLWEKFLNDTFLKDQELIDYVQEVCGMAAIGKVIDEELIIAYGDGANGKSTFWNTIHYVLGEYSGQVSAESLTYNPKHNVKAEIALLRGKRFAIAAELGANQWLNDSMLKQLCSRDKIIADRKYKEAISFKSQHTLVLYTNELPKIYGSSKGTMRRLTVVPFKASIPKEEMIKDLEEILISEASPYVLTWIIEGAKRIIDNNFQFHEPQCVIEASEKYKNDNDSVQHFIDDCCEQDKDAKEKSETIYAAYSKYMKAHNETPYSDKLFWPQMKKKGYEKKRAQFNGVRTMVCFGLKLNADMEENDNFEKLPDDDDLGF